MRNSAARRGIAAMLMCWMLAGSGPAAAMSTAKEIDQGREENKQIDATSILVRDPFLTSWVNRVGGALAQHRIRPDITYTFTVIDDPSINAFAIKGGFVHVNTGLLNFVSSDDELAAILGHEMGHVELHHVTKGESVNSVIGILTGLVSILSLPVGVLASIGGELAANRYSRADELQADHYGVAIASKAGYDPNGAVDVMRKLGKMDPGPGSRADKAFLDHPIPGDRVAHLLGYKELNRPPAATTSARAIHDADEGRYSYARALWTTVLKEDSNAAAAPYVRQLDYALRESGGLAAPDGRIGTRGVVTDDLQRASALRALNAARSEQNVALTAAKNVARLASLELDDLVNHLGSLPAPSGKQSLDPPSPMPATGGSAPKPPDAVRTLNRDVLGIVNLTDDVFSSAPGLIGANRQPLDEMAGPLAEGGTLTPKYAALFAYYPAMTSDLRKSTAQLSAAIEGARTAVNDLGTAIHQFNDAQRLAQSQASQSSSPPSQADQARQNGPIMARMLAAADTALAEANHASDEMYSAQTANLSAELTLLDLYSSPERYAAYRRAMEFRFPGVHAPSYAQVQRSGLAGGDVGCAAWLSFETSRPMPDVLASMSRTHQTCLTLAADNRLSAKSLEIAEGLLFEDYDDSPSAAPSP